MGKGDKLRRSRLLLGIVLGLLAFAAGAVACGVAIGAIENKIRT